MSVIKLSIEELSRLINIYDDLMKQMSKEPGGYDYLRGLLNQVEKVNVTKDLNQLATIENTHNNLYNNLKKTKESLGLAISTYKEQEKMINNMISRNFPGANMDQAAINREFEKLEQSILAKENMTDREKIEYLELLKPDENGYLNNVDIGGVNYEKIKVTKIEQDGVVITKYVDEVNSTILYMSMTNPDGGKFEYGKLWTDNPMLLEKIRQSEIAALEKLAPEDMAPGDSLKLQNITLNGQIYSEVEVKCTLGGQWNEHKFITFTDPKTGKILHNVDYTCTQDTIMRLKAVGLKPGEQIQYTERISAGVYAFDETSFWDDLKGIFSGLLNYGIENIMDIGTLILVVGAGVVVGLGEITGIAEDGATMDILSKIVVGEDEMKKRLQNDMMKGVPGGSFHGGKATGFAIDMLIAFATCGYSAATKEGLTKSIAKIAPDLTEAELKAVSKSALKYLDASQIDELLKMKDIDKLLKNLSNKDLDALLKKLKSMDKASYDEAIKAINASDKSSIDEINKVLEASSKTEKLSMNQIDDLIEEIGGSIKSHPLRQEYENAVKNLSEYEVKLRAKGLDEKEIAKAMHQARRDLGVKYKDLTPDVLKEYIYEVNIGRYGDKLGPTFDFLIEKYSLKSVDIDEIYKKIIDSAKRPNGDVDKLLQNFKEWLIKNKM